MPNQNHDQLISQPWQIGDLPVVGYIWNAENPRGIVLLMHGYGEYAKRYISHYHQIIPTLLAQNFSVYAYDQRGHGASLGKRAVVDLNVLVSDHLVARQTLRDQALPIFAYGHSMGGLVTAASIARDPRGIAGVILSSAALLVGENEPAWIKKVAPLLAKVAPALPTNDLGVDGISRIPSEVEAYQADPVIYHGKVPALTGATMIALSNSLWPSYAAWKLPTLILHGEKDTLAAVTGSQRFNNTIASPEKSLHIYKGAYHELLNDLVQQEVRDTIIAWLSERA